MANIVVGYDDSEPSKRALRRAVELARAFGAQLVVTSVAPVGAPTGGRSIGPDPTDTPAEHMGELASARAYLATEDVPTIYVEAVGHPADSLLAAAEQHAAQMIIVGTRELGFVQRVLGQSLSEAVSHRAHCDVLIVH